MLQHRSSCKPQIEGCSGRRATAAHARRRRDKATAILASKELQDRSEGNDQSRVLCTAQESTPERQKSRRHFRGVFALCVKFMDNNYVRVNALLCVIVYVFIDPFSFHSLLLSRKRLRTSHISRAFSVQATNRLVTSYCFACMWSVEPGLWITVRHVNTRSSVAISAWDRAPVHLAEQQAFLSMICIKTPVKYIHLSCILQLYSNHDSWYSNHDSWYSRIPSLYSTAGPRSFFGYCDAKEYVILSHWCV